jgi:hypothetical protein
MGERTYVCTMRRCIFAVSHIIGSCRWCDVTVHIQLLSSAFYRRFAPAHPPGRRCSVQRETHFCWRAASTVVSAAGCNLRTSSAGLEWMQQPAASPACVASQMGLVCPYGILSLKERWLQWVHLRSSGLMTERNKPGAAVPEGNRPCPAGSRRSALRLPMPRPNTTSPVCILSCHYPDSPLSIGFGCSVHTYGNSTAHTPRLYRRSKAHRIS